MSEARILFELAGSDAADVARLRQDLGVAAGYMSRIAKRFEADGLVSRERSPADARRQVLRLTDRGRQVFALLDGRSAEQVRAFLADVAETDRNRLRPRPRRPVLGA